MFTALPSVLQSLNNIISNASDDFQMTYKSQTGNLELGTSTQSSTTYKVFTDSYVLPQGFIYKDTLVSKDKDVVKTVQQQSILTQDIKFNPKNFAFVKSSKTSPSSSLTGKTLVINSTTITFTSETTMADICDSINNLNIVNIEAYIDGGYLVIFSSKFIDTSTTFQNLIISGTSLTDIGITAGTFKNSPCSIILNGIQYTPVDFLSGVNKYCFYIVVEKV